MKKCLIFVKTVVGYTIVLQNTPTKALILLTVRVNINGERGYQRGHQRTSKMSSAIGNKSSRCAEGNNIKGCCLSNIFLYFFCADCGTDMAFIVLLILIKKHPFGC